MTSVPKPTLYFGYGSNLWLDQMRQRCPTSKYLGVARLSNYHWIISSRGYANVVEIPDPSSPPPTTNVVYGLVFTLQPTDEARLDQNEGVPWAYTKERLSVDFWSEAVNTNNEPEEQEMLVYIDRQRTDGNFRPKDEYVVRMNNGIKDALDKGVPEDYVKNVLRRWIPEQSPEEARAKAAKQALKFEDEN